MKNKKLSIQQIIVRVLFMLAAVAIIDYVFPHHDTFRYEYELGKPWRYGRLQADFDFAVFHPDSVVRQMEDSVRRQIPPIYRQDTTVVRNCLNRFRRTQVLLGDESYNRLSQTLEAYYLDGILSNPDKNSLLNKRNETIRIDEGGHMLRSRSMQNLHSEKEVYDLLRADTIGNNSIRLVNNLQDYVMSNLVEDSAAFEREYEALRRTISASYKVVVAETRIIDQGQIVDASLFEVLESYKRAQIEHMAESNSGVMMHVGQILLIAIFLSSMLGFLFFFRKWHHFNQTYTLVAVGFVALMVVLTAVASHLIIGGAYLVPIGMVAIVLATFHGSRTAYWCHMVMVLLCSFIAPSHFEYIVVQSIVGIVIIFCLRDGVTERKQLMQVSLAAIATYPLVYCAYTLANEGTLSKVPVYILGIMVLNGLLLLMSYLIMYGLEKLFGFMSYVTLSELCNLNQGLLLRLSKEAPGTFQHSMQLGNITAAAAEAIGAKSHLVRTGALYHDIGKLWNPGYYTENQLGENPLKSMETEDAVKIIKRHVSEGMLIAQKEKLPEEIRRFITTHHGAGFVRYYKRLWEQEHPDEEPDMKLLSYEGVDPETKEEAILMMADGVEAASKSMSEYNTEAYCALVNKVVDSLVAEGRLNNAKITLREINQVKESFVHSLEAIYNTRIAYPEGKK